MMVASKVLGDWRVTGPRSLGGKLAPLWRPRLAAQIARLQITGNPMPHSLACLSSSYASVFDHISADVVNLHWVCGEMMSINDIGRISRPVVWTLHDSWAFCGAEHHPDGPDDQRYVQGYTPISRRPGQAGIDIDAWVWRRKRRAWRRPFDLVSPSRWLAACAARSALMCGWPVRVIPNPLPTDVYTPRPKALARQAYGLPVDAPLVLFGAIGGTSRAKGWDLLEPALAKLAHEVPGVHGVIVGQAEPVEPPRLGLPLHFLGHLSDDVAMALLYNAVDVVVLPSRLENLPQMGTEAQACGVPVVGFDCSGLPDVVVHRETGYLAHPYDSADLVNGMRWVLRQGSALAARTRYRALKLWSPEAVVPQYLDAYAAACARQLPRSIE